jgi:DNA-binding MarR family transcriptional regulator
LASKPASEAKAVKVEEIARELGGIRQAMRRPLDAQIARVGLTVPQRGVLGVVLRNQGISLKDLSRELCLAHSTVSGILDRLEKRQMIERLPNPEDGRATRIYATARVADFVREGIPRLVRGPLHEALGHATAEERAAIHLALHRLRELLEDV